jgi:hypothetical protein
MADLLIPPTFLFRFAAPCRRKEPLWTADGADLNESFRLPNLAALDDAPERADVRAAWSEAGLALEVRIAGKRQSAWCRENRIEDSDGFHVWIDTRDTHNIHRAGRFCHAFVFLPSGGGSRLDEPVALAMPINRARENPKPVRPGLLGVRSERRVDGYVLQAHIPAAALTGFDPAEHPRIGFMYALVDRELGLHTFCSSAEFPYQEDPSLWATLELANS